MNKRRFLGAAAAVAGAPLAASSAQAATQLRGPALLTVTGAIARGNRGPLDPALDQMMHKQKISFATAYAFDFAALLGLPPKTIRPTLEYDNKPHLLRGPLLMDVLAQAGVKRDGNARVLLRAVDGYAAGISMAQAKAQGFIVATH
ncbi:MAG TPA: molybdopterin-dependent oxidoreductase, partial [Telluria sp.]|nr:molybdopterin-dependent oxidoreductase [Telluria sp.]